MSQGKQRWPDKRYAIGVEWEEGVLPEQSERFSSRSVVSPQICDTLSLGNAMVACPMSQGSFVPPMRAALSARVSPDDQPILTMQRDALPEFATRCQWTVTDAVEEMAGGVK